MSKLLCALCLQPTNDIRPQIEGVGIGWECRNLPLSNGLLARWKAYAALKDFPGEQDALEQLWRQRMKQGITL